MAANGIGIYVFYLVLALIPVSWIAGIMMLRNGKQRLFFIAVNLLVVAANYGFVFYAPLEYFNADPYNLRKFFSFLFLLGIHSAIAFILTLYLNHKTKHHARQ